mmetsp:Transcript_20188/g.28944  ORF Transcript_20188/g.28944 Transcript_20188/m.28944 type:complete len:471 (+) Transcript_20188:3036-4448(+)
MIRNRDYVNSLLKKFIFQIHPDFFQNHRKLQVINETNLKLLNSLNDSTQENYLSGSMPRSLSFYVKPDSFIGQAVTPRKVSLYISRLEESLTEILETLGVQLPENIHRNNQQNNVISSGQCVSASPKQIEWFLETLVDRRSLMMWREDRIKYLNECINTLKETTGVSSVEFRNSWSAQNNTIFITSILRTIQTSHHYFSLPWTGFKLIISQDDTNQSLLSASVDYLERCIYINPTHTPSQWIQTLSKVQHANNMIPMDTIATSHYQEEMEAYLIYLLSQLNMNGVHVKIKRGFTCSESAYRMFLNNTIKAMKQLPFNHDIINTSFQSLHNDFSLLQFIIEDSHGTKMLSNGNIRLDCKASIITIQNLLQQKEAIKNCILQSQKSYQLQQEMILLSNTLKEKLLLKDIMTGVGVDEIKMKVFLQTLDEYISSRNGRLGVLKHLSGMKLVVGYYLGIADDGSCIVPWDMQLQ